MNQGGWWIELMGDMQFYAKGVKEFSWVSWCLCRDLSEGRWPGYPSRQRPSPQARAGETKWVRDQMVGSELREGCCSVAQSCPTLCDSMRVFLNELALCIRWPKDWSFSFTISLSNEYSGLISFRMDWDSQESSPTPQFKSIHSLTLSFLYGPILTTVYDYWKNHSFD